MTVSIKGETRCSKSFYATRSYYWLLSSAPTNGDTMEKKQIARYCVGNGHLKGDNTRTARGQEVILGTPTSRHDGEVTNSGTLMETSASSLGVGNILRTLRKK